MQHYVSSEYIEFKGISLFTVVLLPEKNGQFPTVILRTPYVQPGNEISESDIEKNCLVSFRPWLERGYAIVFQHCRGQGKSTGAFVPYIYEREDGLALRDWIRKQAFYNGELFLHGGSYTASVHYATAPFEADIKGAVLEVQDSERYRLWYRNGQMRKGHANWHFVLYKSNCNLNKNFSIHSFSELPLKGLSERVLSDNAEDFEKMLFATHPSDPFWKTRYGGVDAQNATDNAGIPILLTTGYNDFYLGGMFKMWNQMGEDTKQKCAMLVSPYHHGDGYSEGNGILFPVGRRAEQFGNTYQIDWFDNIRKGTLLPYPKSEITYYRVFENRWSNSFYEVPTKIVTLPLGSDEVSICYDPMDPPSFAEEGTFIDPFEGRTDVISLCTSPFEKDVFIKGQIKAILSVTSNCYDTSFYISISIKKPQGDYVLRHDITSLCYQLGEYKPGSKVDLHFCFDEYAFLLKKGECLRIDIAPTDNNTYVCHTNQKGPYCLQTEVAIALNKVDLSRSVIMLPVEE